VVSRQGESTTVAQTAIACMTRSRPARNFAHRDALDVDGWDIKLIRSARGPSARSKFADLYRLTSRLLPNGANGEKSAQNLPHVR